MTTPPPRRPPDFRPPPERNSFGEFLVLAFKVLGILALVVVVGGFLLLGICSGLMRR
jgi:nitrate reductase NapE component